MKAINSRSLRTTLALATVAAALAACNRAETTAGEKVDTAVAKVEQKAAEVAADVRQAGKDAAQATSQAADSAENKVRDAALTTAVNAQLANDPQLSALSINVDTVNGRVALRGSAPDSTSRDRATSLASGVNGVMSVDNQLVLAPKK